MARTLKFEGINLVDYQRDFLYCKERFSVVEASTKAGKTQPHIWWILQTALNANPHLNWDTVEGKHFWWVAPIYSQSQIAYKRLHRMIAKHSDLFHSKNMYIETPKGSIIEFKSADNADSLYGEDVYGAVFDEFTRAKQEANLALYSTMTATKGSIKYIGNYKGDNNWGHKLAMKAKEDQDYYYAKITAWQAVEAGILDKEVVEQAQRDLHPADFNALYLCEGTIDNQRLFIYDSILDLFTNTHISRTGEKYITADLAFNGSDQFVVTIWNGYQCYYIEAHEKSTGKQIVDRINELKEKHGVRDSNIVYDSDGPGLGVSGFMPENSVNFRNGARPFNDENYKNLKAQCYYKMAYKARQGELFISTDTFKENISEELEYVRKSENNNDGKMGLESKGQMKKILGRSPDFADALMMRMYYEFNQHTVSDSDFFAVTI